MKDQAAFAGAVERLFMFRQDLEFLPASQRATQADVALLATLRAIGRDLNRALGFEQEDDFVAEVTGPFNDELSRRSSVLSIYSTTGQWVATARQQAPELFRASDTSEPTPQFGFHPTNMSTS